MGGQIRLFSTADRTLKGFRQHGNLLIYHGVMYVSVKHEYSPLSLFFYFYFNMICVKSNGKTEEYPSLLEKITKKQLQTGI